MEKILEIVDTSKNPYKIWMVIHDGIAVRAELRKRNIAVNTQCVFSDKYEETQEHMFFHFEFVRPIWFGISLTLRVENLGPVNVRGMD